MDEQTIRPSGLETDPAAVARIRRAGRLGSEYFLRSFLLIANAAGGRPVHAIVLIAIVDANVAYLDEPQNAHLLPQSGPPPDALRRPASITAIAGRLGLPYETVRRTVAGLVHEGLCRRVGRGYVIPESTLSGRPFGEVLSGNWGNLRRLYRRIERLRLFEDQ